MADIYHSALWADVRAHVIARDHGTCSISRLLGGACSSGPLAVHHIHPVRFGGAPFDPDNCGTTCQRHHPMWEQVSRILYERRVPAVPRCPHTHRTREAREQCERRLAARNGRELVAA